MGSWHFQSVYGKLKTPKKCHFTVLCLVPWPLNRSEAGGDLAMLKTLLLSCANRVILTLTHPVTLPVTMHL